MFRKALLGGVAFAALSLTTTGSAFAQYDVNSRIDALEHELRELKSQVGARDAKIEALEQKTTALDDLPQFDGKKLQVTSQDGQYSIRVGGRIMLDGALYEYDQGPNSISDHGIEFRRARFFISGKVAGDWKYKLQIDFDGDNPSVDYKDIYIAYAGFDGLEIKAGHFKAPHGLETLTSSKYITFMERTPMTNALTPSHQLGVGVTHSGANYGVSAGYFFDGSSVLGDDDSSAEKNEGITARGWFAPMAEATQAVHLGLAGTYRNNGDNDLEFGLQPNNHNAPDLLDSFVDAADWEDYTTFTPEVAVVFGPFSAQAEYSFTEVSGKGGAADVDVEAGYIMASYFLTGESRAYSGSSGKFGRVKTHDGMEIAARYDYTDFSDNGLAGDAGEANQYTLGFNYYFNPYVRGMINYVYSEVDYTAAVDDLDGSLLGTRIQVDF